MSQARVVTLPRALVLALAGMAWALLGPAPTAAATVTATPVPVSTPGRGGQSETRSVPCPSPEGDALSPWLTLIVTPLVAAVVGAVVLRVLEGRRDFVGARRVVWSEMRANAAVLTTFIRRGHESVGEEVTDDAYREAAFILARRLPEHLWEEIDTAYAEIPKLKRSLAAPALRPVVDALGPRMAELSAQLHGHPWWPRWWRRGRVAA